MEFKPEQRKPIMTYEDEQSFPTSKLEREWRLVTGRIMQRINSNPQVRQILLSQLTLPLTENMAMDTINAISKVDDNLSDLPQVVHDRLFKYLSLPSLPKDATDDPKGVKESYGFIDEETGLVKWGLLYPEQRLVLNRYKFARDVKTLALGVELAENLPEKKVKPGIETTTANGCKIFLSPDAAPEMGELLDPSRWISRTQIKDRVYLVKTAGKEFILKERKTGHHHHIKKHGHVPGNSSREEFDAATELNQKGVINYDGISMHWERPLGYVEFPDGFQFTVFEKSRYVESGYSFNSDYGLSYSSGMIRGMADVIISNRAAYEKEYQQIAKEAETVNIFSQRAKGHEASFRDRVQLFAAEKIGKKDSRPITLSFEEFARVKAFHLYEKAYSYRKLIEEAMGYKNEDHDGFTYFPYFDDKEKKLKLVVASFDFEYMIKYEGWTAATSDDVLARFSREAIEEIKEKLAVENEDGKEYFYPLEGGHRMNRLQAAAYMSLLSRDSRILSKTLPESENN